MRASAADVLHVLRKFAGVLFEVFEELFEFTLHRVHLFAHIEDDLDARKIYAKFACK